MKETSFIQQNKDKWLEFEEGLKDKESDPEKMSNLFIQLTDDLSYSRTYYPNRSIRIYLNNLAQKVFLSIYKNKVSKRKKLYLFWAEEVPVLLYSCRKQMLFSFALFTLALLIGAFSSKQDPDFVRLILSDAYVEQTEANIAAGDPMAIYKSAHGVDMFLGISINNLKVAFFTYLFGLVFGMGTIIFILYNGIMVGAFQYFFIERDLFQESFLTIWVHGALEIPAIAIAGAAGMTLGGGILFPGTYTRLQSFRKNAMRGLMILVSVVPIIILAAIIESFLTRFTETPDIIRGGMIAIEFLFMYFYFIYYPNQRVKQGLTDQSRPEELLPEKEIPYNFISIKKESEVFANGFSLFRKKIPLLLKSAFLLALFYCSIFVFVLFDFETIRSSENGMKQLYQFLNARNHWSHFLLNTFFMSLSLAVGFSIIQSIKENSNHSTIKSLIKFYLNHAIVFLIASALIIFLISIPSGIKIFLVFGSIPFILLYVCQITTSKKGAKNKYHLSTIKSNFGNLLFLYFSILFLGILMILLTNTGITQLHLELITWNIPFDAVTYVQLSTFILSVFLLFNFMLMLYLLIFNFSFFYFSNLESETATNLKQRIQSLGKVKKH